MTHYGISNKQIQGLINYTADHAISIYLPTALSGQDVLQGRLKLKNFLIEAERRLVERGMRHTLAIDLLSSATQLEEDAEFWKERFDAMAIFIGPNLFEVYHLPFWVPESLTIGHDFYIRPLLHELNRASSYCVLALERNDVRLILCNGPIVKKLKVDDMPADFETFFTHDHVEKQQQSHSSGPVGAAGSLIRHGAGDKGIDLKERIHRFCLAISRAIEAQPSVAHEAIVLVGTKEMQDSFRSVSKLAHVLPDGVTRSGKGLSPIELQDLTSAIVEQYRDGDRQKSISHYNELAGTGYTSQQIEEILVAASQGKVDVLLSAPNDHIWGTFDVLTEKTETHAQELEGDQELINAAAVATLKHGGRVFDVLTNDVQLTTPLAAIYRY